MEKNKDIKEAEIEESKKEEKVRVKDKKSKSGAIYVVICCIILLVFGAFVVALVNIGLINFDGLDNLKFNKKATLNYTETNTKQKSIVSVIDVSGVVEDVMPSIVAITSKTLVSSGNYGPFYFGGGEDSIATGAGSGIIISQTDDEVYILTNNHVVEDADELSVQFIDGKSVDATVKGTSPDKDVAVIYVKTKDIEASTLEQIKIATIGDSSKLKVGNGIIAIGNALGYGQSVTVGVVSALDRELQGDDTAQKMIQIDAAINGGNSGGALLNSTGEVVGINSAKYSSNGYYNSASIEGMGFAIPISDVKELIEDLMAGKQPKNTTGEGAKIGITGDMVSGEIHGFYISEVTSKNASKAGLQAGCIVTKVEGKEVTSMEVISDVLKTKNKGDKITLTIAYPSGNKYKEKDVKVKLS